MTENNEHLALWGGRFTSGPSPELARLSKSTQFDWRLADDDIAGSRAHARALGRAGLLTADELQRMEDALDTLQRHVDDGSFAPIEDDEDEATALERGLIDIAGDELGGKLRAGRSRNDQIACLIRMWLRRHSRVIAGLLLDLVNALIEQSEKAGRTVMPGRTHMQHAQPVLLAHQLMAHAWPLIRDVQRLIDWDKRINASPYGSGALADVEGHGHDVLAGALLQVRDGDGGVKTAGVGQNNALVICHWFPFVQGLKNKLMQAYTEDCIFMHGVLVIWKRDLVASRSGRRRCRHWCKSP